MPLRIGLVGCGHMGRIHLEKLKTFDEIEIAGIVDINHKVVENLSKVYSIPFFTNYRDLIALTDGVIIAAPTINHYEIAKAFLEHGSHVFIEKPITLHAKEAQKLISIAKKNNLLIQIGHLERFNPVFAMAYSLISEPLFVDTLRIGPFTGRSTDIDVVLDLMIHDIDLVLSLIKSKIVSIKANGIPFITDKLDIVHARIEFSNGSVAHLNASRVSPVKRRMITVFEKKRFYMINLLSGKLSILKKHKGVKVLIKEYNSKAIDPVKEELLEFIHSIKKGKRSRVTGEDALNTLNVANRIKQYIEKRTSHSTV